ncbi:hypothetical protein CI109_103305 [Kwoniella shandongensis]|uniref:Uncharacterized protein n=1 Tax=Kwoniella shandongensis TaxID=1734106 RepID=A0A5M6BNP3_9TREE|nr:uncharacterized protein CI109_007195 [Kwoniella shandongensis]KAA5524488.1 hypothetical protein CI109_007195 [Kwoniella shandongensis]
MSNSSTKQVPLVGKPIPLGHNQHPPPPRHPVSVYDVCLDSPETETPEIWLEDSPLKVLMRDARILARNAKELLVVLYPPANVGTDTTWSGLFQQVFLVATSIVLTIFALTSFAVGFPSPILMVTAVLVFTGGLNYIQGSKRIIHQTVPGDDKFPDETWLFVNGIATSRSGLQLILNRFYELFGRKVIGIHNRTFGFWFDVLECIIQREFLFPTADSRDGYNIIAEEIAKPHKKKIVLMAHSQGGIILSAWVDQLLSDFSTDVLAKVEIYTFASAATHFSIPATHDGSAFARVEHFVNTRDYVARIGLLAFAPPTPIAAAAIPGAPVPRIEGRFAGRIFKREGHTGHLLLSHYLKRDDSILDDSVVRANSWLATYL